MYSYKDIFSNKQRILFVTAHPDDVDVFFGGTLCKLKLEKKETYVLIITSGGKGSKGKKISENALAKERMEEEKVALKILGHPKQNLTNLGYLDGEVENNLKLIGQISLIIRRFKPQIICTHEPHGYYYPFLKTKFHYINHRDHRNTGLSTLDAVYPFSRDRSFFTEQLKKEAKPHDVYEILLTDDFQVNTKIDISDVVGRKRAALLAHKSQFDKKIVEEILSDYKEGNKYFEAGNYIKLAW